MKVRLAFYRAQWGKWTDMVISLWTWPWNLGTPPYSHVEIGFEYGNGWHYFSSSARKNRGTRWIDSKTLFKHPKRWDVYEIIISEQRVEQILKRIDLILDRRYDWLGVLGFLTITGKINSRNKWYCSEAVHYVFVGLWKRRISPRRFWRKIMKWGFERIFNFLDDKK